MRTHYNNLRVPENADSETIKVAYKQLVQKWHPDKHPEGIEKRKAERVFSIITSAYEVLSDEYRRKEYDRYLLSERMHYATTPKDIIKHDHKAKPAVLLLGSFSLKSILSRMTPDITEAATLIAILLFIVVGGFVSGGSLAMFEGIAPLIIAALIIIGLLAAKFFHTKKSF